MVGLDIGDGESALCWLSTDTARLRDQANIFVRATGEKGIITATAWKQGEDGRPPRLLFGEEAVLSKDCFQFGVNFKNPPDPLDEVTPQTVLFAQALLGEFFRRHPGIRRRCVVYIGHPTGWPDDVVAAYAQQFHALDVPVQLMPESQSALVHVRDRRATDSSDEYGYRGLRKVLVVDIGSSTTDFTFVDDLVPCNLPTGASLGCRQIDKKLVERVMAASAQDTGFIEAVNSPGGKEMLLLVCRRAKEIQFSPLGDDSKEDPFLRMPSACDPRFSPIMERGRGCLRGMDIPGHVVAAPGGWADGFRAVLAEVAEQLEAAGPELIVLTGGGSRMPVVRTICMEIFPDALVENDPHPGLTVARGLASAGRHRVAMERFRDDIGALKERPDFTGKIREALLDSFDVVKARLRQRLEQALEDGTASRTLLDELIDETTGGDEVREHLRKALETSLIPLVQEICRTYGVKDDHFRLNLEVPDVVGSTMRARLLTICRAVEFSKNLLKAARAFGQGGSIVMRGAVELVRRAGSLPTIASAGVVGTVAGAVVGSAMGVEKLARRRLDTVVETAQLEPDQVQQLVEQVAEAIMVQMDARAVEIERFLF
ncbi:Hsp70 family protein [Streptomyces sp. NPDC053079]|uniref:Hsp70 family protein n=1 Tax=Streptomyces sp. NPDC053079 TaxID=3365697 RepID=UPI0037D2EEF4